MREERRTLVSVVVPAYNAGHTIGRTLRSVRNQTHRELEIIVVDDGSSDLTRETAERHARDDARIRVVVQKNGGVAAARNAGIAVASGDYVAPVDADDLWRPDKIERQLRALNAAGEGTGLIYSWSAEIDRDDRITSYGDRPHAIGDVLLGLAFGNFVGNGSTALMRKRCVVEAGGYDASLRARRAQGCEDWKLFLALAERTHFAVVYDYLTGYRQTDAAMSGDVLQMLRSDALVREAYLRGHPEHRLHVEHGRREYILWMLQREMATGRLAKVRALMPQLREATSGSTDFVRHVAQAARRSWRRRPSQLVAGMNYLSDATAPSVLKLGQVA